MNGRVNDPPTHFSQNKKLWKRKMVSPGAVNDFHVFRAAIKTYLGIDNRAFAIFRERFMDQSDYMNVLSDLFRKDPDDIILDLTNDERELMINDIINDPMFN